MTSEVESCGPESTFAYADFKMDSTLVTDFDMVCDQAKEVSDQVLYKLILEAAHSDLGPDVLLLLHAGPRPGQPRLRTPLRQDRQETHPAHRRPHHQVEVEDTFCSLFNILSLSSIASVVASQMPGYVSYAILRIIIGAGAEGWSEQVFIQEMPKCKNMINLLIISFIVAFAMVLEIVGCKEEVKVSNDDEAETEARQKQKATRCHSSTGPNSSPCKATWSTLPLLLDW